MNIKNEQSKIKLYLTYTKINIENEEIELNLYTYKNLVWEKIISNKINTNNDKELKIKKVFTLDFIFEKEQQILIKVIYTLKGKSITREKKTNLGNIVSQTSSLFNFDNNFILKIGACNEETNEYNLQFNVTILHTKPKGIELFYVLSNSHGEISNSKNSFIKVFKSEEVYPGENNDWVFTPVTLPKKYFILEERQVILFQVMIFNENKSLAEELSSFTFTVEEAKNKISKNIELKETFGIVKIRTKEFKSKNFVDYIFSGMEINLIIAIDYTGSNGHPNNPNSLHYIGGDVQNQYEKAIRSCGDILAQYDEDSLIPLYGFGGVRPKKMLVEHVFPLNSFVKKKKYESKTPQIPVYSRGKVNNDKNKFMKEVQAKVTNLINKQTTVNSDDDSENNSVLSDRTKTLEKKVILKEDSVAGIEEVIEVYKNSINKIVFSGPTNFSPLIEKVSSSIRSNGMNNLDYFILLIITDGQISDLKQTINLIVNSSDLPLSIVIVGVGDDDFSSMEILDGDDFPLTSVNNKITSRDIIQFVPFNTYSYDEKVLGAEILKEVPGQVESYFLFNNIKI